MGIVVAMTGALSLWIVLWAVGFGRIDDSFTLIVPPILIITMAVRMVRRSLRPPPE